MLVWNPLQLPNRFNSQPPEGGWLPIVDMGNQVGSFNSQPPEGGWGGLVELVPTDTVSTHSRPKAAG